MSSCFPTGKINILKSDEYIYSNDTLKWGTKAILHTHKRSPEKNTSKIIYNQDIPKIIEGYLDTLWPQTLIHLLH